MLPSRKIAIGACCIAASVLIQIAIGLMSNRALNHISSSIATTDSQSGASGPLLDQTFAQSQRSVAISSGGYVAVCLLLGLGLAMLLLGIYQNAKATENLLEAIAPARPAPSGARQAVPKTPAP